MTDSFSHPSMMANGVDYELIPLTTTRNLRDALVQHKQRLATANARLQIAVNQVEVIRDIDIWYLAFKGRLDRLDQLVQARRTFVEENYINTTRIKDKLESMGRISPKEKEFIDQLAHDIGSHDEIYERLETVIENTLTDIEAGRAFRGAMLILGALLGVWHIPPE